MANLVKKMVNLVADLSDGEERTKKMHRTINKKAFDAWGLKYRPDKNQGR